MNDPHNPQNAQNDQSTQWQNLVRLASRDIYSGASDQPPLGFSTRVAALAMAARRDTSPVFWKKAILWSLPISATPALLALVYFSYAGPGLASSPEDWATLLIDPLIILDL